MLKKFLFFAVTIVFPLAVQAQQTIELFDFHSQRQKPKYNTLIHDVQPDAHLVIQNSENDYVEFKILNYLGHGATTRIFEVAVVSGISIPAKSAALRLPYRNGVASHLTSYSEFIDFFIEGVPLLAKADLIPKVYDGKPGKYVLLEKIDIKFSLEEYLLERHGSASDVSSREYYELILFAKKMAPFSRINDIRADQIVFDGNRWVLIDHSGADALEGQVNMWSLSKSVPIEKIRRYFHLHHKLDSSDRFRVDALFDTLNGVIYNERMHFLATGSSPLGPLQFYTNVLTTAALQLKHLASRCFQLLK